MKVDPRYTIPKITPTTVNTKEDVLQVLRQNLDNFRYFKVSEVALFGSFVRNEADKNSDVDIVVTLKDPDFVNFYNLTEFCDRLFTNRTVDVITKYSLTPLNGKTICRELEYVENSD